MEELHHTKIKGPMLVAVVLVVAIIFALVVAYGTGERTVTPVVENPTVQPGVSANLSNDEKTKMMEALRENQSEVAPLSTAEKERMMESLRENAPPPLSDEEKEKMMEALRAK